VHDFWTEEHPICGSELNLSIAAIQAMSIPEFRAYAELVRRFLGDALAEHGIPPHNGTGVDAIERDMRLHASRSNVRLIPEIGASEANVIDVGSRSGAFLRCLFPNMSESADGNGDGASLSEYLTASDGKIRGRKLIRRWAKALGRLVHQDRMYVFSRSLTPAQPQAFGAANGVEWVRQPFNEGATLHWTPFKIEVSNTQRDGSEHTLTRNDAYILARLGKLKPQNAGFEPATEPRTFAKALIGAKPDEVPFTFNPKRPFVVAKEHFRIRTFKPVEKLFPKLFSIMKTGVVIQGTNFPPPIAKFLYRRYTERLRVENREIVILDPSAGYGGRCYGALAAASDGPLLYIGVDPNTRNWITPDRSRYDVLADYYRATVGQRYYARLETYCCGSEDVASRSEFQKHKGKVDLVFTSPLTSARRFILASRRNPPTSFEPTIHGGADSCCQR
jgi:hypothetical protein